MLKYFIAPLTLVLIISGAYIYVQKKDQPETQVLSSALTPSPTLVLNEIKSSYVKVKTDTINLISNVKELKSTSELIKEHSCEVLINAGFYTVEGRHIGLFRTENVTINKSITHTLFNAFLSIDNDAQIGLNEPPESTIALQSGPLLLQNSQARTLKLVRDEPARRVVAGTTSNDNEIVFMVFYGGHSLISGPYLKDLPQIVKALSDKEGLDIQNALNLDGGAHSVFITKEVQLTEIQPVGGVFCVEG